MITAHQIHDYATALVAYSSLIYWRAPHPEDFASYPRFQKAYNFLFIFLKAVSLNRKDTPAQNVAATPKP
jgi:hypothetical protein